VDTDSSRNRLASATRPARILVYGVAGSGKSTFARLLSERTGLPWHSVDDLMWEPGWVPVPADDQRAKITEICSGPRWILDTAYSSWLDVPLSTVELIVGLDYPRWVSYGRLLRRTGRRLVRRTEVCNGNVETLRDMLARDSLLYLHFGSFGRKRRRMRGWHADPAMPTVVLLPTPRAAARWLRSLPAAA
jgi:adenylate kinase family enzyme